MLRGEGGEGGREGGTYCWMGPLAAAAAARLAGDAAAAPWSVCVCSRACSVVVVVVVDGE